MDKRGFRNRFEVRDPNRADKNLNPLMEQDHSQIPPRDDNAEYVG